MSEDFGKTAARLVAENADSYGWTNLTLAVQLLLPLALVALIFARKKIWIYPYPLLDTYLSALCPSFSQQQRLLKWMSSRIPHMNNLPNKITQYWQNGSLLCTLINTVVPGACPNPQKHWKKPPTHGQALAYKYLGVAPVLTEGDFNKQALTSYSERKFIKYLLSLQEAINKATIEEENLKFTSKYVARGMGLVIGEQNRPSVFYIYPNNGSKKLENILVNIKGPYSTFGGEMISSNSEVCESVKDLVKMRKDNAREQNKLTYKSTAQRMFFRSVSFDIGPIINLMGSKKSAAEISVKVEMEKDRAKVTFLPKFSGIYELLLTNDGQHLQGSPFIARVMKSNKEIGNILQESTKFNKSKLERRIIGQSIDFISESVAVTDDFHLKVDSNNNSKNKDAKDSSEANKSDDESIYQDSGIFDISDQSNNRNKQIDLDEIDGDSRFSEISDNTNDDSKNNSLDYNKVNDGTEILDANIDKVEFESVEVEKILVHDRMPDDIKFLTNDFEDQSENGEGCNPKSEVGIPLELNQKDASFNDDLEQDIFNDDAELQSNQEFEFENLYNKYANDENETSSDNNDKDPNNVENITNRRLEGEISVTNITNVAQSSPNENVSNADFKILSNIPEFQKGKKITSVERMVEIFEKDPSKENETKHENILEKDFTDASPVLKDIVQEAIDLIKTSKEDSEHLDRDVQLSSKEDRPILSKDHNICLDDDEIFDTNVREMKNIFEKKEEIKRPIKKFVPSWKRQDTLNESKKKLAKSLPDLLQDGARDLGECDEFVIRFKEKRNFWNNIILQNSNGNLSVSNSDISANNTKLLSKKYQTVSQSVNSLNTSNKNKLSTVNKWTRKKDEISKTTSLDLSNNYDEVDGGKRTGKITRAESLYDRIRIFDKDFDSGRHNTLLKRTKEKSGQKDKLKFAEILKPESLTEVPNTTSNDQIEEDLHFAEIMKERFEISRSYFRSLESLTIKPNLTRRHSMDSKTLNPKEIALQRGGSLKVLNVLDKFSLDNIYKDVILSKLKNCNFRGSPNKEAVVETLSSVSSCENCEYDKEYAEEDDLNMQLFNIKKRLRKRRSIRSIFDVNY